MRKFYVLLLILILGGLFVFGTAVKYGGTLKAVDPWGPLSLNLNPLLPAGQHLGIIPEIYEPLFYVNALNGKVTPLLGTSYKWENGNLELVVTIRRGVKWSDGTPFTAKDVTFTFNYIKEYPALDTSGIWSKISGLQSVETEGNTVVFKFSRPNTPLFSYIASVVIIPEHIWSKVRNPEKFVNEHPVGTGPFIFKSFSPTTNTIIAVKNPDYWMKGKPYINKIELRSVNSNTTALLSMLRHEADWSFLYVPDVKKTWAAKSPTINKFWWPVTNTNVLYLNTQKYPFDNPTFRKAIAMAIDKEALEEKAYYGIGGIANPTGIIPTQEGEWLDPTLKSMLYTYSPKKAQELLVSIGFRKNSDGLLTGPDGKILPTFKILVGSGWTDFITMAQVISQNLKTLGISTTIDQEPWGTYISSIMTGTYDMAICWGTGTGPTPYYLYYQEFNPAFSASKIGERAVSDYARYTNPLITSALKVYSETSNLELQKQAMHVIEQIVLEDVPFIPLTNRTNFEIFSERNFVGWPSDSNPYCAGENIDGTGGEMITLNIHLK